MLYAVNLEPETIIIGYPALSKTAAGDLGLETDT
jgi:hypothetical protein